MNAPRVQGVAADASAAASEIASEAAVEAPAPAGSEAAAIKIRVQTDDFDTGAELAELRRGHSAAGAVAAFIGAVRDVSGGEPVDALELEHYPEMTERALHGIAEAACARWRLAAVTVIHRVGGPLRPTDQIVLVAVASAHRGEAFEACEFVMDFLKTEAPFWKKEGVGEARRWVDARESDDHAKARWHNSCSDGS